MSSVDAPRLYKLLPAVYRLRDAEQGYPLRALIEVFAGQAQLVESDIARLYENWFIETCDEWVVPYLGDLLGVRGLLPHDRAGWSQRALVANTLQYRQRKGTVPLLEQLVHDVTDWAGRAVELYNEVGMTQYLNHLRSGLGGTASLRELRDNALVGSAFDPLCYTADVRLMSGTRQAPQLEAERPAPRSGRKLAGVGKGRPNLPNIGLYIWRLKPYRLERATAFPHDGQRFSFSPVGNDIRLFNAPDERRDFTGRAQEHELPVALRIEALANELTAHRRSLKHNLDPPKHFFRDPPPFEIYLPGSATPLLPEELIVCDLSDWTWDCTLSEDQKGSWTIRAAVDPVLGRIALASKVAPGARLKVSYSYAFSDTVGGGPYERRGITGAETDTVTNPATFGTVIPLDEPTESNLFPLGSGLEDWATMKRPSAVILIAGNATHPMPEDEQARRVQPIELDGSQLVIQAANRCRAVIMGDLHITGSAPTAEVTLSGLLIAGQIRISGILGKLTIVDCTCIADSANINATDPIHPLQIHIERSIVGPVILNESIGGLNISDSIIDAGICQGNLPAIAGNDNGKNPGPATCLERVTVLGRVHAGEMRRAENVLFTGPVKVRLDSDTMNNCYLPDASDILKSKNFRFENCLPGSDTLSPVFTSQCYGDPGYAQLSLACPAEIRTGGTNGAEIGVFHRLRQPQREGALLAQLEEYLRFGLEVGLIYVD